MARKGRKSTDIKRDLKANRAVAADWDALETLRSVGENLRRMREGSKLTQEELADRAGTAQSRVAEIENGTKNPTVKTLDRLSTAMGQPVRSLFDSHP